ncbi:MAG: UDP-2,4-diacetamido-2,4,6-trideoxy-beta-L-altropyranose hydrolase, partial [Campylobacterota bacterium]|nr:UDP-2,4-diacetamido-2,4,6-trideoxy-beta-L-altropyranose hydrolase [Campylobacterota bacterium]
MRDLVLAKTFPDSTIIFATQALDGNINHKIQEADYTIEILHSNAKEALLELIEKHAIDLLIIDNYAIDYEYEKFIKDKTDIKIFVLDDTYEKHHCDILLNHNISADAARYKDLVPPECEVRCGSDYTLLRDEFIVQKQKPKASSLHVKNVLIAMGGADHSNQNINILKVLEGFNNIHAHVVTTTANQHLNELKNYIKNKTDVTLHVNSSQIAKLMHEADFAIATPSVTINEILYMELPFVAIKTADNQKEIYEYLHQHDYLVLKKFDADTL